MNWDHPIKKPKEKNRSVTRIETMMNAVSVSGDRVWEEMEDTVVVVVVEEEECKMGELDDEGEDEDNVVIQSLQSLEKVQSSVVLPRVESNVNDWDFGNERPVH